MKNILCYVVIIFAVTNLVAAKKCPQIPKHYQELNCEPIIKDGDECPLSYKCPEFKDNSDPKKCLVNGKLYNSNDSVPDSETGLCRQSCICDS